MSIEEQIKTIAKQEIETPLTDIEKRLKTSFKQDNAKLKEDLDAIAAQIEGLDENLKEGIVTLSAQTKKETIRGVAAAGSPEN